MKIAMVASEAAPFVKTGGLGDVLQALPQALSEIKNNEVSVFIPLLRPDQTNRKIRCGISIPLFLPPAWAAGICGASCA